MPKSITRVKINKGELTIEYEEGVNQGIEKTKLTTYGEPDIRIVNAFDGLADHVLSLCELPKDYFAPLKNTEQKKLIDDTEPSGKVTQVDFGWEGSGAMTAIITAKKKLNYAPTEVEIKTPKLPDEGMGPTLPQTCTDILNRLLDVCQKILDGNSNVTQMKKSA